MINREDIEILAPAGSWESLRAAVAAGADAVYFGVGALNMRSGSAANFTPDDLPKIVRIARRAGVRTRLTVNTVIYDEELDAMRALIDRAAEAGVDAVIASDQAAILYARERGMAVHISTQVNVSNVEALRFYAQWADTVVLARELTLEQVRRIADAGITGADGRPVRIEMFAHGALCMAVSGKCYLSLHECGESANRGACRQICRRSYRLTDTETGAEIAADGRYLLSPKDLCTLPFLDRMLEAGVRVLKIEGRARSAEYVSRVVGCYREAVEAVVEGTFSADRAAEWVARLGEVFNRGFWGGYYLGAPTVELTREYGSAATRRKVYVGRVTNFFRRVGVAEVQVEASPLDVGDRIVIMGATTGAQEGVVGELFVDERPVAAAPQGKRCSLKTAGVVRRGDKLYKIVDAQ
jgi:putative protease